MERQQAGALFCLMSLFLVGIVDTLRVVVKWKWTQSISKTAIFLAYIAVPYNAVLLDCVQRGGYLS